MSDSTIDGLPVLTGAALDVVNDLLVAVDVSGNVTGQISVEQFRLQIQVSETGAYTLTADDADKHVQIDSASAVDLTVPPNSSVPFPIGTRIDIAQLGTGQVTIDPGAGVDLRVPASLGLKLYQQYSQATITKIGTDEWLVAGHLEP